MSILRPFLQLAMKLSAQEYFFPFYHTVGNEVELPHLRHLYPILTESQFEKDIDTLLTLFEPIAVDQLNRATAQKNKPQMLLSFDDGLRGVFEIAHPILKRKGVPYVVFVNPSFVDNSDLMHRCKMSLLLSESKNKPVDKALCSHFDCRPQELSKHIFSVGQNHTLLNELFVKIDFDLTAFLKESKPYMSSDELKLLTKEGVTIGGHSMDHPLYENLTLSEQLEQTSASVAYCKSNFNQAFGLFAFPFTDSGVRDLFFTNLNSTDQIDFTFGTAKIKIKTYNNHFQRLSIERPYSPVESILLYEYSAFLAKKAIGKTKVIYS